MDRHRRVPWADRDGRSGPGVWPVGGCVVTRPSGPDLGLATPRLVSPFSDAFGGGDTGAELPAYAAMPPPLASPFAAPAEVAAALDGALAAVPEAEYPAPAEVAEVEYQAPPPRQPKVRTSLSSDAHAELPQVLRAKVLASLETVVPTERILWMVRNALATRGAEPGWADRLLVDLPDLPKAGPRSTVHVTVFETVPFDINQIDKLEAFQRFCRKAFPSRAEPFHALTVGVYTVHRALEDQLLLPAGSIGQAAGVPPRLTVDQAANYKLVVYALLPETVGMVVAPPDHRSLRRFAFDKATLTDEHEQMLDSLAREVVRSWFSRKRVVRISVDGHTDPVGGRTYNYGLGKRRAEAVAKRLKELINTHAGRLPAGTVESIAYAVESFGEDRPFSSRIHALNRRVEITLHRDHLPPPKPIDFDDTSKRVSTLIGRLDPETGKRIECLLRKLRQPGSDDRFASDTQVFLVKRDGKPIGPTEWNRVRSHLLDPGLFAPTVPDAEVVANLRRLDEQIAMGVVTHNRIVDYASGADHGLGLRALPTAFKQFNAWLIARLKDPDSIYSCYDFFL